MKNIALIFVLFIALGSQAQKRITIGISSDTVNAGDVIELKYLLENIEAKFELPDFSDLDVIAGPSVSTSISIVNGVKSQKVTYTLYIRFEKEGTYTIPGFKFMEGEEEVEVQDFPIKVTWNPVSKGSSKKDEVARQRSVELKILINENGIETNTQSKPTRKLRKL